MAAPQLPTSATLNDHRLKERIMARAEAGDGCWTWPGGHAGKGYPVLAIGGRNIYVHRIMLALKLGRELAPGEQACHRCDNPGCINPAHLFAGTQSDNLLDASRKGRNPAQLYERARFHNQAGENNYQAKLSDGAVEEIRALYAGGGITQEAIGRRYGVSQGHISGLISHRVHARCPRG